MRRGVLCLFVILLCSFSPLQVSTTVSPIQTKTPLKPIHQTQIPSTPIQISIPYSANLTFEEPSVFDSFSFYGFNQDTYVKISIHSDIAIANI